MRSNRTMTRIAACAALLLAWPPTAAMADESPHPEGEIHLQEHLDAASTKDIAKQVNNPLATLWTLQNQFDITTVNDIPTGSGSRDDQVKFNWGFQPVLPLHITKDFNLLNRAVITLLQENPVPDPGGSGGTTGAVGFGDTILANILAPNKPNGFIWGIGPTWQFPSASSDFTGTGKYSVGPAAAAIYIGEHWVFSLFPQQWFSYAGDGDRDDVSLLDMQYGAWRLFPGGWQVGFAQDLTVNWKATSGNKVTFPIGIGVGRTFPIGGIHMKIDGQISYAVVSPDDSGQRVGFRIRVTPVIAPLCCKGTMF